MLRGELANKISERTEVSKEDILQIMDVMVEEITDSLKKGEEVKLFGFGKFIARKYGKRKCYNPVSGEIITLKSSVQPAFIAGPKLREELNK